MEVKQVYQLVNQAASEVLGKEPIAEEDLSKVIDMGTEIFNADAVDNYVKKLVDHIGRVVFVDRPYSGSAPSVLMDGWEFGSVMQKIRVDLPDAEENESWKLVDGQTYNQDKFTAPKVSAKFFNDKTTFQIATSIAEHQVKESFDNAAQLNGFVSMIFNSIDKGLTLRNDALIMRTLNNMIAQTMYSEFGATGYGGGSKAKAVNLLYLYNQKFGKTLSAADAVTDAEFIRYATFTIGLYSDRMARLSSLFNIGGTSKYTPKDLQHIVLLSEFVSAASAYLQSDTFHDQLVALPKAETVTYWQGSGTGYSFTDTSKIDVKIDVDGTPTSVSLSGIIGVIFDRDALGVANMNKRVKSHPNEYAEFVNYWYKVDAHYFTDTNENFVVFYVADPA